MASTLSARIGTSLSALLSHRVVVSAEVVSESTLIFEILIPWLKAFSDEAMASCSFSVGICALAT